MADLPISKPGEAFADDLVVRRVLAGDTALFEVLMRRYNQRLYRVARGVLQSHDEAKDVVQETYLRAYAHLSTFDPARGRFATWLTKIALYDAVQRGRRRVRAGAVSTEDEALSDRGEATLASPLRTPEEGASDRQLALALGEAVDALPADFRTVFVLRAVEQLSTAETAECLDIPEQTVKTRLFRARALIREDLRALFDEARGPAFPFLGPVCDAVVARVLQRINADRGPG